MAHIQHVVDQAQQMISRRLDLFKILFHLTLLVHMCNGKIRKPDNRIHRCPDIVRHIGKKDAFCLARFFRTGKRILKLPCSLHLVTRLFVDVAESQNNTAAFIPGTRAHRLHLKIPDPAAVADTIVQIIHSLFGKLRQHFLP